jgi:hypothetical protein
VDDETDLRRAWQNPHPTIIKVFQCFLNIMKIPGHDQFSVGTRTWRMASWWWDMQARSAISFRYSRSGAFCDSCLFLRATVNRSARQKRAWEFKNISPWHGGKIFSVQAWRMMAVAVSCLLQILQILHWGVVVIIFCLLLHEARRRGLEVWLPHVSLFRNKSTDIPIRILHEQAWSLEKQQPTQQKGSLSPWKSEEEPENM